MSAAGRHAEAAKADSGAGAAGASNPIAVLAVTCAAAFIAFLDVTIVNTAFPDIERDFAAAERLVFEIILVKQIAGLELDREVLAPAFEIALVYEIEHHARLLDDVRLSLGPSGG